MAIAKVQTVSNTAGNATSAAVTITATTGNTLVVAASAQIAGFVTVSDGVNTYTLVETSNWDTSIWVAKNITGGALTITVSGAATAAYAVQVLELSGVHATTPTDGEHDAGSGTTSTNSGATPTATNAGDYVVGIALWSAANTTIPTWSSRAFSPALASQTDETAVGVAGTSTAAGMIFSHGPIAGLNAETFSATSSSVPGANVAACLLLKPAAVAAAANSGFLAFT